MQDRIAQALIDSERNDEFKRIDQAGFNKRMEMALDSAYASNIPQEKIDALLLEWKGGRCIQCKREYIKVKTSNAIAEFEWFKPDCACLVKSKDKKTEVGQIKARIIWAGVPKKLRDCTFANWDHGVKEETTNAMKTVYEYTKAGGYKKQGHILYGDVGTGKTHCMVAVLETIAESNLSMMFISMGDLIGKIFKQKGKDDFVDRLTREDILAFDDMDKIYTQNSWIQERIYILFDKIIINKKIILGTTNFKSPNEFVDKFGEAVTSRLIGACQFTDFQGDDYRNK